MDSAQFCTELGNGTKTTQSSCTINSVFNESSSQEELTDNCEVSYSKKIYKCSQCESTFFRYSHLQDHMNHHTKDRQYQCKEINCSKAYFKWSHLRRHLICSHKFNNVKKPLYVKKEPKIHKCSYEGCNATYDRHWKLTSHMWKHTGEKCHSCSENGCSKAYTTVGHLRRHVAKSHMPSKKKMVIQYICSEDGCEKVYMHFQSLRRHYLKYHGKDASQEPPLHCTSCDRNFKSLKLLSHHKCASYKCEECNLKFINVAAFKNHMKKIHNFKVCSKRECNKVFSKFSLLKEHKKTEHMQFFTCPTCSTKISSKRHLKEHQQTHRMLDERLLFTCPYSECRRLYTRKFNLDQHIKSSHEDIKFHCTVPGCEKRLVTKQKLQEHMKLHDSLREPLQRKQIARRQRKDVGQPKRSMAVKLSGVSVSFREEQNILHSGDNKLISNHHISIPDETSECSDDGSELFDLSEETSESSDDGSGLFDLSEEFTEESDES